MLVSPKQQKEKEMSLFTKKMKENEIEEDLKTWQISQERHQVGNTASKQRTD